MKTKRTMKVRTCYSCKGRIEKGDQYARKSVRLGETKLGTCGTWEAYRVTMPVCEPCGNPGPTEDQS